MSAPPPQLPPREPEWPTPDPWQRPVPDPGAAAAAAAGTSGLEILRATMRGELPPPPIDRLTGTRLLEAEEGRVVFAMPGERLAGPGVRRSLRWAIALLGMSAASGAVQAVAEPDTAFAALDMKVNLLRPVQPDGTDLVATGTVLHRGRRLSIATSDVHHGGRRVAVVTGTTALTPRRPA